MVATWRRFQGHASARSRHDYVAFLGGRSLERRRPASRRLLHRWTLVAKFAVVHSAPFLTTV